VVRQINFLECKIRPHRKIENGATIIMRIVSVNLERCGIYGVGVKVKVEVVLPDQAIQGHG
jgi:hypothetical protein